MAGMAWLDDPEGKAKEGADAPLEEGGAHQAEADGEGHHGRLAGLNPQ